MSEWTADQLDRLKICCGERMTYTAMARITGKSRNSCIGKARRMKITNGRLTTDPRSSGPPPPMPKFKSEPLPKPEPTAMPEPESLRIPIENIRDGLCRWITSDTTWPALMCGHEVKPGSVYCSHHSTRAYTVQAPRVRAVA